MLHIRTVSTVQYSKLPGLVVQWVQCRSTAYQQDLYRRMMYCTVWCTLRSITKYDDVYYLRQNCPAIWPHEATQQQQLPSHCTAHTPVQYSPVCAVQCSAVQHDGSKWLHALPHIVIHLPASVLSHQIRELPALSGTETRRYGCNW